MDNPHIAIGSSSFPSNSLSSIETEAASLRLVCDSPLSLEDSEYFGEGDSDMDRAGVS